nr:transporter substrate-binding domain-containing protein [Neiella litorisoli]
MVPFPLLKGLASYRLFITTKSNQQRLADIDTAADLKQVLIGQGEGWSTANILQSHGYKVVYGSDYAGLFKMLEAQRFQLLMRGVYEAEREIAVYRSQIPDLEIYDRFAVYTYLPMYFWVSKQQPELADRLHYGLMKAHDNGELDLLFQRYFSGAIALLGIADLNIIELENTNIDPSFYRRDRPFLLSDIH